MNMISNPALAPTSTVEGVTLGRATLDGDTVVFPGTENGPGQVLFDLDATLEAGKTYLFAAEITELVNGPVLVMGPGGGSYPIGEDGTARFTATDSGSQIVVRGGHFTTSCRIRGFTLSD